MGLGFSPTAVPLPLLATSFFEGDASGPRGLGARFGELCRHGLRYDSPKK